MLATPGSSVKEQVGANYASRLATNGFVALAFDPAHQGQGGGEPRNLEDPYRRGEDLSYAIDTLSTLPGIDPNRIGALGICAGGGYAVHTARTDHRIKALGTVVANDIGEAFRGFQREGAAKVRDVLATARIGESADGRTDVVNWLPDSLEAAAAIGLTDLERHLRERRSRRAAQRSGRELSVLRSDQCANSSPLPCRPR